VSIVERPVFDEKEWKLIFNLRQCEENSVLKTAHWLCIELKCDPPHNNVHSLVKDLASDLRSAMLAFQVWCPKGWSGTIVNTIRTDEGPIRVHSVCLPEHYAAGYWASLLRVDELHVDDLKKLIDGTLSALKSECTQVCNPFQYLEIGLQTTVNHPKAGGLLWMIGLDALLGAQGEALFTARLCRFLGKDTRVFPIDFASRRPVYTIGCVASDIYTLRNQIAHGDRIANRYVDEVEFEFDQPDPYGLLGIGKWSYQSILWEAALFALCASLRKVILEDHLERVKSFREWKRWLGGKFKESLPPPHPSFR
jgi:hypothetical protein